MAELALDDVERHALTRELERMRVAQLVRAELPVGPQFCIIDGPTRGRPWSGAAVRCEFRRLATRAGVRRRFAPCAHPRP